MQDKEVVFGTAEENSSESKDSKKGDSSPKNTTKEKRDSSEDIGKKQQHGNNKDSKFQFRRMKPPKKEKAGKKSVSRFKDEGVSFRAKLIGVDEVPDARGDKMCQDSMHRLKLSVKALGPHKRKIIVYVSLQGIKIKDEKSSALLYHHPVPIISFISQDITDARAFGYVAGSSEGQHEFIAIKTEKPAFHVVVALRDLFQTVLNWKQEEMDQAKKLDDKDGASSAGSDSLHEKSSITDNVMDSVSEEEKSIKEENIYFDVILTEPFNFTETETAPIEDTHPKATVDDLLDLQDELNKLQQGIAQMDTSIAAATYSLGVNPAVADPFDTSFVTPSGPKDVFSPAMPAPVPVAAHPLPAVTQFQETFESSNGDKYAIFNTLDYQPSIFTDETQSDGSDMSAAIVPDLQELEEEIKKKSVAPSKPPRGTKATPAAADPLMFADLDPLGKDRPYKDKTEFFQDVKNPPKKVLNDFLNNGSFNGEERLSVVGSPPFALSTSPSNLTSPMSNGFSSSSLPNSSFLNNLKFSVGYTSNGSTSPFNPFENEVMHNNSPPNGVTDNHVGSSSSPIPIPNRNRSNVEVKERSVSNGSIGSPCSRSPNPIESHLNQNGHGSSPLTNGFTNGVSHAPIQNDKAPCNVQNGVSRPRPRPSSVSKGSSAPSSSHLSSNDNDIVISRANMQSIANVLRVNGHRTRAGSFPVGESQKDFRIPLSAVEDIFAKKSDPFNDGFFCSLPKKVPNHLSKTEISDYV